MLSLKNESQNSTDLNYQSQPGQKLWNPESELAYIDTLAPKLIDQQ